MATPWPEIIQRELWRRDSSGMARLLLKRFGVEVFEAGSLLLQAEALLRTRAPCGSQTRSKGGIAENAGDGLGESAFVALRNEHGRFIGDDSFGDAGSVKSGDGQADGLRFAESNGEALGVAAGRHDAGHGKDAGAIHQIANDAGGLRSEKGAAAQPRPGLRAKRIEQRAITDDEQLCGGMTRLDLRHGADEVSAAFLFDEPADEENDGIEIARAQGIRDE